MVATHLRSFLLILLVATMLPNAVGATPASPAPQPPINGLHLPEGTGLRTSDQPVGVLIELWDLPVLIAQAAAQRSQSPTLARQTTLQQARIVTSAQDALLPRIDQVGGQVAYRLQRTLNAIAAYVPANRVAELERSPSVRQISPLIPKSIDNSSSVPLIGAPQLWSAGVPLRGERIKIGVLDTGIDYIHTMFGGSGLAADYTRNNTLVITDSVGFPGPKIVGGYDFAGDDYNASTLETFLPKSDPDPMDCNGHGTHVAGTVGGYGVNANGTTYRGPWNATGVPTNTMRIGPGVAPLADLYALRVFGCSGTTALVAWALEWATDPNGDYDFSDHLDVVNLSLGAPFGSPDYDGDVVAANNAALAGVIVVAAAGNSSDTFFNVGNPSTATWAISVASSIDSTAITGAMRVNAPAEIAGLYPAYEAGFGFQLTSSGPVTGTVRYPGNQQTNGCAAFNSANTTLLRGNIALVDRGGCSLKTKVYHAQVAGAIGVLIANNVPGFPAAAGDDPAITTTIRIPSMMITQADGALIKSHLNAAGGLRVTLTGAYNDTYRNVDTSLVDAISSFSSRGPRRGDGALKPDISAPGDTVFSAKYGTGNAGTSFNGTSMATPHVAGAMALLRQLHPDWSVEELKALVMNTANVRARVNGQTGALYSPSRQGAGRIVLPAATQAKSVAFNADTPGLVSISFGFPEVIGSSTQVRNVRVVNKRDTPATYNISFTDVVTASGITLTSTVTQITVPPNGSNTFAVIATIKASELNRTLDPATSATQEGAARQFINEHSGYLVLSGPDTLQVPYYLAPRPVAQIRAEGPLSVPLNATTATLRLQGQGTQNPAFVPRTWALELHEINFNDSHTQGMRDAGDLKYIGLGSNVTGATGLREDSLIYFGLATFGPWTTPLPHDTQFQILFDTNNDQWADFALINSSLGQARNGDPNDVFVAALYDLRTTQRLVSTYPINAISTASANAPYNSSVIVLPVRAWDLGLRPGRSRFTYVVEVYTRELIGVGDISYTHSYDPAIPAISLGGPPVFNAAPGTAVQLQINRGGWLHNQAKGLLLLHELNATTMQSEVVPLDVEVNRSFLPVVRK